MVAFFAVYHKLYKPARPTHTTQEGLYLDSHTQRLLAQVVAYNPELRLFSSAIVAFEFGKGGSVQVRPWVEAHVACVAFWRAARRKQAPATLRPVSCHPAPATSQHPRCGT